MYRKYVLIDEGSILMNGSSPVEFVDLRRKFQRGSKWYNKVNPTVFCHLGLFWAYLNPFQRFRQELTFFLYLLLPLRGT